MKFLVTVTPSPTLPPAEAARSGLAWLQERRENGTFESIYAYPQTGGFIVYEAESFEWLMEDLMDYPLAPWVSYDVKPLVELDGAFGRLIGLLDKIEA
jgi:hypothetical protein